MTRPTKQINSSGAALFDGLEAVCWFISMNSNILSTRVINTAPGQLYTFVFTQNGIGNHTITWPSNCLNANPIDPSPNATTVQHFIGLTGGMLYANLASSRA